MIAGVRIAMIGRIIQKSVTRTNIRTIFAHFLSHQVRSDHHMDWQAFRGNQQLVFGSNDATGKITARIDYTGASCTKQGICHLAYDRFKPRLDDGKLTPINFFTGCINRHYFSSLILSRISIVTISPPSDNNSATAPGSMTTEVKLDSIIAGPLTLSPADMLSIG